MSVKTDIYWMKKALELASKAEAAGEVPVGAIIVKNDDLVAQGWNQPIGQHDPNSHAEIEALRIAGKKLNNYRIPETTLYVTLEPCTMCVGAMIHARVGRVVYGASDPKTGALGGAYNILELTNPNHVFDVTSGVLQEECSAQLKAFFKVRR